MPVSTSNISEMEALKPSSAIRDEDLTFNEVMNHFKISQIAQSREVQALKLKDLHNSSKKVRELHELLKEINKETDDKGEVSFKDKENLKALLEKAKELGVKFEGDKNFTSKELLTKDKRDLLVKNIEMTIDDLKFENNILLNDASRMNSEMNLVVELAKSLNKSEDNPIRKMINGIIR